ncbi:MAG TPA: hypothetical protein VE863_13565 [Pyrinomonadaceae bacterium]|jgi:hypothetical protein|nr:hypothetical protein [Pyrinomonadaceae bacterium]
MPDDNPQSNLNQQTKLSAADKWNRIETISKVLSIAAIPVVLAVGGWIVQRQIQNQSVAKDYVQLAVTILTEPDKQKIKPELRDWAVDTLNAYSEIKLKANVAAQLKAGDTVLPNTESFKAVDSSALTPDLQAKLTSTLKRFQSYLLDSGYSVPGNGDIGYQIIPGARVARAEDGDVYATYDPTTRVVKVAEDHVGDFESILTAYTFHILEPDYPTQRADSPDYEGISYGLAAYLPCSFREKSVFEENEKKNGISIDLTSRDYNFKKRGPLFNQAAWACAFWDLRKQLGKDLTDKLLAKAWSSWEPKDPNQLMIEFVNKLVDADQELGGGQHKSAIQDVFRGRGLAV